MQTTIYKKQLGGIGTYVYSNNYSEKLGEDKESHITNENIQTNTETKLSWEKN